MTNTKGLTTNKRLAITAMFIALGVIGAYLKLPSPTGTVALDSLPGFLASLLFGPVVGCISIFLGHIASSLIAGFPLTLPLHLGIALCMTLAALIYCQVAKRGDRGLVVATVLAIIINGPIMGLLVIPVGGMAMYYAMLLPLSVGSAVNIILSSVLYRVVKNRI